MIAGKAEISMDFLCTFIKYNLDKNIRETIATCFGGILKVGGGIKTNSDIREC